MTLAWTTVPAPAPIQALTCAVATDGALAHVGWGHDHGTLDALARTLGEDLVVDEARTHDAASQLSEYLAGRRRVFDLRIDWRGIRGSRLTVLQTLFEKVPYGRVVGYGELAEMSGAFAESWSAARGVGSIMGSNPVPVVVPCHRVLASAGGGKLTLGGFGGGLPAKEWLLALEGVLPPALDLWTTNGTVAQSSPVAPPCRSFRTSGAERLDVDVDPERPAHGQHAGQD
ncbi:methylated-DNA--[protein]-cysteine S-methyltransferase [Pseudonocardia sp. N23]|uniref:methylated-DNA--[protein]-cysteine S-methyltransferase n=1 Tax=Pseudonocardia sp. N23 TaxID=1987376 RepID=UPI000BFDF01A|nr:methylated-DNA--[protein]-cysteine S-methyltransferase [Pseudonocardia sp. N23]